jgi:hypothetical protein
MILAIFWCKKLFILLFGYKPIFEWIVCELSQNRWSYDIKLG